MKLFILIELWSCHLIQNALSAVSADKCGVIMYMRTHLYIYVHARNMEMISIFLWLLHISAQLLHSFIQNT